jgi:hypothetical protein
MNSTTARTYSSGCIRCGACPASAKVSRSASLIVPASLLVEQPGSVDALMLRHCLYIGCHVYSPCSVKVGVPWSRPVSLTCLNHDSGRRPAHRPKEPFSSRTLVGDDRREGGLGAHWEAEALRFPKKRALRGREKGHSNLLGVSRSCLSAA